MTLPPPSPNEHALLQRVRYMRDPLGYIDSCRRELGDLFMIQLRPPGMVLVCSPELAKAVYTAGDDVLAAGEAKIAVFGKLLGRASTLLLDGDAHLERRRLLLPRFRGEIMQTFGPVMVDACRRSLDAMPIDETFALHPFMHRIAYDVISQALFSATPATRREALLDSLREFANRAVTSRALMFPVLQRDLGKYSPWGRVLRIVERTRADVLDEINRRRHEQADADDITGLLLATRGEDGTSLADLEIRDEIMTMVAAGHETTAMALTWLCYAVFTRPAVLSRLVDELADRRGADVESLLYLDAVVRESLRFYSLIPNGSGRVVKRSFELGGYQIPEGAMVSVAFHAIHRRSEVFERADEFWPDRFLSAKYTPYQSVAFGGGTRRCLGMPFALYEIKLVLATLLERHRLTIAQREVRPSWRGAFLTPSKGLRVRVRRVTPARASAEARA